LRGMLRFKVVIALLAAVLCICMSMPAMAAGDTQTQSISLHRQNPDENVSFKAINLFPGDSVTRYYRVKVSYTGTITVFFQAKPDAGDEKLSEVLKIRVRLMNTDEILYEGSIGGMPVEENELSTNKKAVTDELQYEITVSLGTEAGNEYQEKKLTADFIWWAEGSEAPPEDTTEASTEMPTEYSTEKETEDSTEESTQAPADEPTEEATEESAGGGNSSGGELVDPPDTGDHSKVSFWLICVCIALIVFFAALMRNKGNGRKKNRRWAGIISVILLTTAFGVTSFALMYQKVMVEENLFATGKVSICLNDDQPVFDEEILFEPGMRIVKEFTLRNDSTCEVYYRLWFSEIEGEFADELEVCVIDRNNILFEGTFSEMSGVRSEETHGTLAVGEQRVLAITFHVPEDCKNDMQGQLLRFNLNADAVQAVNNPDGVFE